MTSATRARPLRTVAACLFGALLGLAAGCGSASTSAGTVVKARPGVELPGADPLTALVPAGRLALTVGRPTRSVDGSDTLDRKGRDAPEGGSFVPVSWTFDPLAVANLPTVATAAGLQPATLAVRVDGQVWPIGSAYQLAGGRAVAVSRTSYVAVPDAAPEVTVVVSYDGLDQSVGTDGSRAAGVAESLYHPTPVADLPCPADGWHASAGARVTVACQLTAPAPVPYVAGHGWMGQGRRWLGLHLDATPSLSIGGRPADVASVTDRTTLRRGGTATPPLTRLAVHHQRGVLDDDLVFDTARDRPPASVRVEAVVTLRDGPVHRVRIWRNITLP